MLKRLLENPYLTGPDPQVRCYRIVEKVADSTSLEPSDWLMFEDTRQKRFVVVSAFTRQESQPVFTKKDTHYVWNALSSLLASGGLPKADDPIWQDFGAETMDGAFEKFKAKVTKLSILASEYERDQTQSLGPRRQLQAHPGIEFMSPSGEEKARGRGVRQAIRRLMSKAESRKAYWSPGGKTPAGREFWILVIEE